MSTSGAAPPGVAAHGRWRAGTLALAAGAVAIHAVLATAGDLRARPALLLVGHVALLAAMLGAWRTAEADRAALPWILAAALAFRVVAAFGEPALSDDVYRYVWDGRLQLAGVHPYAHAPSAPEVAHLRDVDHARINHPGIRTIYPPAAQLAFAALAAVGAGPTGFRLAFGLLDFGAVLMLWRLARRLGASEASVVLYAWNPLAVLEGAGSGHVEPLGVLLLLVTMLALASRRGAGAGVALGAAIGVKLLPIAWVASFVRRAGTRAALVLAGTLAAIALPYAARGPAIPPGTFEYAARWEANSVLFPVVQAVLERLDLASILQAGIGTLRQAWPSAPLPWEAMHAHVWPQSTARAIVALAAVVWIALVLRRRLEPVREALRLFGGVLLLSPTLHPWYLLWVLPFAALCRSPAWLALCALAPLAYLAGEGGVPWGLRAIEYGVPLGMAVVVRVRAARRCAMVPP